MPTTYTIRADAASAVSDGATTTAGGTTIAIGGAAPNKHALLRFDTSTVPSAELIVSSKLSAKVQAQGATPISVTAWAADFGAGALANADWNVAASNATTAYRVKLKEIIGSTAVVGDVGQIVVPSRFVKKGASALSDFELRPTVATTLAAELTTIHGAGAVSAPDKPTLDIITVSDAELRSGNIQPYRFQGVGAQSYVAFDIETTPGTPVKAKTILEATSSTLDSYAENLQSRALSRNRVRPRKIAIGRAGAGGEVSFELTPEKCWRILPGVLKRISTSGSNPYTHLFKNAQTEEIKTFTFVQKNGPFRQVFPGGMISSLRLAAQLDDVVTASAGVMCRDEYIYAAQDAGTDDEYILSGTAAYDSVDNSILSFVGAIVTMDGVTDGRLIQNFNIDMSQDVQERRGLNRERGVVSHFALGFRVDVSFSMYFENEVQLAKFLGQSNYQGPWTNGKSVLFQEVVFKLAGAAGEATQEVVITLPKLLYTVVRKPINSEGAIMLDCSAVAVFKDSGTTADSTAGQTSIQITVMNSEPSTVFDASTDTITVLPPGK